MGSGPAADRSRSRGKNRSRTRLDARRFVERLFGGRLSPLVARLAAEDALDDEDIAEIEALLRELKS